MRRSSSSYTIVISHKNTACVFGRGSAHTRITEFLGGNDKMVSKRRFALRQRLLFQRLLFQNRLFYNFFVSGNRGLCSPDRTTLLLHQNTKEAPSKVTVQISAQSCSSLTASPMRVGSVLVLEE